MVLTISKKRLFVKNGLLYSELNSFFKHHLVDDGYVGLEIRPRGTNTDLVLRVTRPNQVVGDKGRKIRELQTLVQHRFNYEADKIKIFVDPVKIRALSAAAQCENLKDKLLHGIPVRKACYGVVRSVMGTEASGVEVVVSGKIRGQRAKSMKFVDGIMIHAGDAVKNHVDFGKTSVLLKQGVLGIKVKINKAPKKSDENYNAVRLPDHVHIFEPKEKIFSDNKIVVSHDQERDADNEGYGRNYGRGGYREGYRRGDYSQREGYRQREGYGQRGDYGQRQGYGQREGYKRGEGYSRNEGYRRSEAQRNEDNAPVENQ